MNDIALLNGRTFLFVDDEPVHLALFRELFASEGCQLLVATNSDEAYKILEEHHKDISVIISDYSMPGETGVALLQTVLRRWPHISRVMTTAASELSIAKASINKGQVAAYFNKPWQKTEVLEAIGNAVLLHDEYTYNNQLKRLYADLENQDQFREELIAISGSHILDLTATMSSFYQMIDDLDGEEYENFLTAAHIANNMIASHVRNVSDYLSVRDHSFITQSMQAAKRALAQGVGEYYRGIRSIELMFSEEVPDLLSLDIDRVVRMLTNTINYVMIEPSDHIVVRITVSAQGLLKFDVVNTADCSQHIRAAGHVLDNKKDAELDTHHLVGSAFGLLVTKSLAEQMGGHAGMSNTDVTHLWFAIAIK